MTLEWLDFVFKVAAPVASVVLWFLWNELKETKTQLAAWQLEVVKMYATKAELREFGNSVTNAVEKLERKIDKYLGGKAEVTND